MGIDIDKKYVLDLAAKLLKTDSPSGFCFKVMEIIEEEAKRWGGSFSQTEEGSGVVSLKGDSDTKKIGLTAHVDTLGGMVRSITEKGELRFTGIGAPLWPTLDGEYCTLYTRGGGVFTGTLLSTKPAIHVFKESESAKREPESMVVRLDEVVKKREDVEALGIRPGDYIAFDPNVTITESGFIKSRFLDDKIGCAILLGLLKWLKESGQKSRADLTVLFSTLEETGHGASYLPTEVDELVAVDMGCIGEDLSCSEYDVSICAKDSSGPYNYSLTTELINLAEKNKLNFAVDIYPFYSSDVSAAKRAGHNFKGALIGPGVHASHGMERTHWSGVENCLKLLILYLTQ